MTYQKVILYKPQRETGPSIIALKTIDKYGSIWFLLPCQRRCVYIYYSYFRIVVHFGDVLFVFSLGLIPISSIAKGKLMVSAKKKLYTR